jgi:hypothetical protein
LEKNKDKRGGLERKKNWKENYEKENINGKKN